MPLAITGYGMMRSKATGFRFGHARSVAGGAERSLAPKHVTSPGDAAFEAGFQISNMLIDLIRRSRRPVPALLDDPRYVLAPPCRSVAGSKRPWVEGHRNPAQRGAALAQAPYLAHHGLLAGRPRNELPFLADRFIRYSPMSKSGGDQAEITRRPAGDQYSEWSPLLISRR